MNAELLEERDAWLRGGCKRRLAERLSGGQFESATLARSVVFERAAALKTSLALRSANWHCTRANLLIFCATFCALIERQLGERLRWHFGDQKAFGA